ncbi:MAG: sugar MFS transporter [Candidatus Pseudobacter hemicellulosilyticus]|uniref:Sugar MFS transporter n=1 Tax=Candidatus Pseudobacter hemicellulosilyticus TaxID=3121375 RepID=A0AAJ6BFZ7_9BACT|nr:MAG: sugar MFS transporter [Pseudobacter sp.]
MIGAAHELTAVAAPTDRKRTVLALVILAFVYFALGFITCLNDSLVPFFKKGFSLNYTESSLVQFYFFIAYAVFSIPVSILVRRTGYKKGIVTGFLLAALGAILFYPASVAHQYWVFLLALFILALGIVLLQVAVNPYVTILGPAETASSRFTLVQGVGSIGTTVAPLFGAHYILAGLQGASDSSEAVRYPYLGIALALVVMGLLFSRLRLPDAGKQSNTVDTQATSLKQTLAFRNLKLGVIAIFMYVGAEVAIGTFLTNYISDVTGLTEKQANPYVAFYWGGMLVGRLLGSVLLKYLRPPVVLCWVAVGAMLLVAISLLSGGFTAVYAMVAVGLCNAVMFAIIFSLAVAGLGQHTMSASGLLSTAIVGGAIIPFLQGMIKDHNSWDLAFLLPVVCYAYILFYGWNGYKSIVSTKQL